MPQAVTPNTSALAADIKANFPWLVDLNLFDEVIGWAEEGYSATEIYGAIQQTAQYAARFPAIKDPDGQRRYTEAEYIEKEQSYRSLMSQYGDAAYRYDDPSDFAVFFDQYILPEELQTRFETYSALEQSSQDLRAAFYVYAGIDLTTDDLYTALVNDQAAVDLERTYNERTAATEMTWAVYRERVSEFSTREMAKLLTDLSNTGIVTTAAAQEFLRDGSAITDSLIDAFTAVGLDPTNTAPTPDLLSLPQMQKALQQALIGSAATTYGFALPEADRIQEWIEAGVDRADAGQMFGTVASQGARLGSVMQRAGIGTLNLQDALLQGVDAVAAGKLRYAVKSEDAAASERRGASISTNRLGSVVQQGLRVN